ncbi:MAG: hypothetical protein ABJB11_19090 [Ferruginibacter sp.]
MFQLIRCLPVCLLIFLCACNDSNEESGQEEEATDSTQGIIEAVPPSTEATDLCWWGLLNKKTSVLLHYSIYDKTIVGTITYLNTKLKTPIKILGAVESDNSYRLLEFEEDGNITGIITGKPAGKIFNGSWFSPKSRKEFPLELNKKDSIIESTKLPLASDDIFGSYHYQYSQDGQHGQFELNKLNDEKIAFSIFSVTSAPERNMADIPLDTIPFTGNSFIYKIPGSDSCELKVTIYNNFLKVDYTKGHCTDQFGWNATVEGIFLKEKKKSVVNK